MTEKLNGLDYGSRLMLIGHLLNGVALTLVTIGSILRDKNEIPSSVSGQKLKGQDYWED